MNAAGVLFVIAALGQVAGGSSDAPPGQEPKLTASIRAKHDVRICAEVQGLLTKLPIDEGMRVTKGQVLGAIDDRQAVAAVDVAKIAHNAADERAKDNIEERYARAAAGVAQLDYEMSLQANAQNSNTISRIDVQKKKLDWTRATLQTEKAQKDQRLAQLDAETKAAELRAAEVALVQRTIVAPFDGEIQLQLLHESEWVNPGDPIFQLVQFDVMEVECLVSSTDYDPAELQGRPVTVSFTLARGRQATVQGHVVFVSQSVIDSTEGYGEYLVRAEVENKRVGDFWLVRPGLPAQLTIHVNQPPVETTAQSE